MAPKHPRSLRAMAFGGSRRNSSPLRSPSPTFSDTTNVSGMNFGADGPEKIITRANLKASIQAYEELMNTSSSYRAALITMSKATAAFANAMEACSGLKGPSYEAGTRLQAASGLHHLVGNQWHVLAETLDKQFEKPLRQSLDTYRAIVTERSASYERALREKSQMIRDTEMRNMNKKERNLQSFREALGILQRHVDELDDLKAAHYHEIIEHEEQVWDVVQGKVCVVVRSTMEVFDRFTAKASDPILEPMLQSVPDPFDSYGPPQSEDQIFSILPPLSIMTAASSSAPSPSRNSPPELDTLDGLPSASSTSPPWSESGIMFPSGPPSWADVPSLPQAYFSPPAPLPRRHSAPTRPPKQSESKLRGVLAAIDESRASQSGEDTTRPGPSPINGSGSASPPETPTHSFSFTYGQSHYEENDNDVQTPRHSTFLQSQSPPLPPDLRPDQGSEPKEPDGRPPLIPIAT